MALVIFDPWAPACKGQLFLFTIRDQLLIEKFRATIGVNAQEGEREKGASLCKGGQHCVGAFFQQGETFGPAGGEIGQRQGVEKPVLATWDIRSQTRDSTVMEETFSPPV